MAPRSAPRRKRKNSAAVLLGRRGGKVKSEAKAAAARANGLKGGDPRRPRPEPEPTE